MTARDATPGALAAALAELQADLPHIAKGETATVTTEKAKYSYTYATLPEITRVILPRLSAVGLSFIAKPAYVEGVGFVLAYALLHTSGEREDGQYPLPTSGTPQAIGSAITYGRRYCLCAVTGLAPDDDDDAQAAQQSFERPSDADQARNALLALAQRRGLDTAVLAADFAEQYGEPIATADAATVRAFTELHAGQVPGASL